LLDAENINDQGIDAAGVTIDSSKFEVRFQSATSVITFTTESNADALVADGTGSKGGSGPWTVTFASAAFIVVGSEGIAQSIQSTDADTRGARYVQLSGNLYGSSRDVGSIPSKLPTLSEVGGRVNRVGFKRKEIEGSFEKFGFFDEYTQESLDFDTDADLATHINREMVNGAVELTEAALQVDLLNSAGVVRFAGDASSKATIGANDLVNYSDLLRLSIDLDNNRTPKHTKIITGTRMIDTRTIRGGRVIYIGSELIPTLEAMVDLHGKPAFIQVHQYAAGTTVMNGEIGSVGHFRYIVVPEMLKWAGAGADATASATHYETGNAFDVFPMLCIGEGSFTTIGFQTDGKTVKFKIKHKKPDATYDRTDPYGEMGFMSIKWHYGFMLERPERLALVLTAATL
jgi:N4-gp56 family major capsid protein